MPQCLLTMHMIIMVHYKYWDNNMGTRRTNYSTPPLKKIFFLNIQLYIRPTLIITMYTILLFIHYRIMANYMQDTLHSEKCLSDNFHTEKMSLLLLHIL